MRVKKIIPCVCIDHRPDVSDSVYYGMPQLKVSGSFDTSMQFYSPYCPNCGRGGCVEYKSAYLALKSWNEMQESLRAVKENPAFIFETETE